MQGQDNSQIWHELYGVNQGYTRRISAISADHTITNTERCGIYEVTTGAGNVTITLPDLTSNKGRTLFFKKIDAGAGNLIISRAGTDTIEGANTITLAAQWDCAILAAGTTVWTQYV